MQFFFADQSLDGERRELRRGGELIALEPQVFDLLVYLLRNRDRVLSKDDLVEGVWGGRIVSDSTLTSRISALRKAVGDTGEEQRLVRTYPRKGIRFIGEVREASAPVIEPAPVSPMTERNGPPLTAAVPEARGKPSVAVLAFNNMSGDSQQDYFSDGITEDIITALSRHRSLFVIARNSSFAFRGHGADVRRVGLELGADYIVEGSVRRSGQRVRVTAQLVETEGGRHVWAERYDRDIEEIFAVQDEITAMIAARIEPEVGYAERERAHRKPPQTFDAWDFFRLGTKHFYKFTPADNAEAQRLFRRAIELDPELAQAYGFLAWASALSMEYFDVPSNDVLLDEAVAIARTGVKLDDRDALNRFMYGRALLVRKAYAQALAEFEAAVDLNPSLAMAHCGVGDSLAYNGRLGEAIPHFQKAVDLSPHDPMRWAFYSYGALARLFAREFNLALEWAEKATRVPNCHFWGFAHRVAALGHLRRADALAPAVAELIQRKPDFSCGLARERLFYIRDPGHLAVYLEGLRKASIPE